MSKNRLEAFSDGVFAVAITLLVLNIHLDRQTELTFEALRTLAPEVLTFVLSFVIVGVYWVSHHNMLHQVKAVDRYLLWLNLTLLLAVVFLPFSASLLGSHPDNPLAVELYGLNLMTVNAVGTVLWLYVGARPGMLKDGISVAAVRFVARLHSAPILIYAIAVMLAPRYIVASIVLFAAVPAFFILPNPYIDRRLGNLLPPAGAPGNPQP